MKGDHHKHCYGKHLDLLTFYMGETTMYMVSTPSMIDIISNEEIMRGLMENTPLIIMVQMGTKFLGS
jgi:hypothetical protein